MKDLKPDTPIQFLKGVGPRLSQIMQQRSVYTAWDLLFYFPYKYIDRRTVHTVKSVPVAKQQTFLATVVEYASRPIRRGRRMLEILVGDEGEYAKVTFFRFNEKSLQKRFPVGSQVLFLGDIKYYKGMKTVAHPDMEPWDVDDGQSACITPLYPLTDGLHQKTIQKIFQKAVDNKLKENLV